jgi:CubicO group peptidase (beta-lactamase class C family)
LPTLIEITDLLESARKSYCFSGYQLTIGGLEKNKTENISGGILSYWSAPTPVTPHTLFDIGSVTKAVATTTALALAYDRKWFKLDFPVSDCVPEWKGSRIGDLTFESLLTHSSGLIPWFPIYLEKKPFYFKKWILEKERDLLSYSNGAETHYSDIGFLVLGEAVQGLWKLKLADVFKREILNPLGMSETQYGPVYELQTVATEYRVALARPLQSTVFDENCDFLGGECAHAGLFSSAKGLVPFCREWLLALEGKSTWLSKETAHLFSSRRNRIKNSTSALGWDCKSEKNSSAGNLFSPSSFGHLGYPGCSIWIDPEIKAFAIFHSNRVHPLRLDERIRELRPRLHDAIHTYWKGLK